MQSVKMEEQLKAFQEKNCKLLKKNMELVNTNRLLQDKLKTVTEDYTQVTTQAEQSRKWVCALSKHLSEGKHKRDCLEKKLEEAEKLKKQLSEQTQVTAALKQACCEKDRRIELIHHRKKRKKIKKDIEKFQSSGVKETFYGYEEEECSVDSEPSTASSLSFGTPSENEIIEELSLEELSKNYQQLMHEHLELQKTYALLQSQLEGCLDPQRQNKVKIQLESDLFLATCRIQELEKDMEEIRKKERFEDQVNTLSLENKLLSQKVNYLKQREQELVDNLKEAKEDNANLEFQITELEECSSEVNEDSRNDHDAGRADSPIMDPKVELGLSEGTAGPHEKTYEHTAMNTEYSNENAQATAQIDERPDLNSLKRIAKLQIDFEAVETQNKVLRKKLESLEEEIENGGTKRSNCCFDQGTQTNIIDIFKAAAAEKGERNSTSSTLLLKSDDYDSDISSEIRGASLGEYPDMHSGVDEDYFTNIDMDEDQVRDDNNPIATKMARLHNTCDNLEEKVSNAEMTQKQLREKLKLAERTINDLESSEGCLREQCDELVMREVELRQQIGKLNNNCRELNEIIYDKESNELAAQEKVKSLEDDVSLSKQKISELENSNQILQHRLDLKEETEADIDLIEQLKSQLSSVRSQNEEYEIRIMEFEENEELLHENWKSVAEEENSQKEHLMEKIKMLELMNSELKFKLNEQQETNLIDVMSGHSIAQELSLSDFSKTLDNSVNYLEEIVPQFDPPMEESDSLQNGLDRCQNGEKNVPESVLGNGCERDCDPVNSVDSFEHLEKIEKIEDKPEVPQTPFCECVENEDINKDLKNKNEKEHLERRTLNLGIENGEPSMKLLHREVENRDVMCEDDADPEKSETGETFNEISAKETNIRSKENDMSKLEKKLELLLDAETKLMERVVELEEMLDATTDELNKSREQLMAKERNSFAENHIATSSKVLSDKNVATEPLNDFDPFEKSDSRTVTGLFERSKCLETENQELKEKVNSLLSSDAQVKRLSDKVKILEQSEDKLMERVIELEEGEDSMKMELSKVQNQLTSSKSELLLQIEEKDHVIRELQEKNSSIQQDSLESSPGISGLKEECYEDNSSIINDERQEMFSRDVSDKEHTTDLSEKLNSDSSTRENIGELSIADEMKLLKIDQENLLITDELRKLQKQNDALELRNEELENVNMELSSELQLFQDSESELLSKQHELMMRIEELESKIHLLELHVQNTLNEDLSRDENMEDEKPSSENMSDERSNNGEMAKITGVQDSSSEEDQRKESGMSNEDNGQMESKMSVLVQELCDQNISSESKQRAIEKLISLLQSNSDWLSSENKMKLEKLYHLCFPKICSKSCQTSDMEFSLENEVCDKIPSPELDETIEEKQMLELRTQIEAFHGAVDELTAFITAEVGEEMNEFSDFSKIRQLPEVTQLKLLHLIGNHKKLMNRLSELQGTVSTFETGAMVVGRNEDVLKQRIMELEDIECYLRTNISDLEHDRQQLHQKAQKDRDVIHNQNICIKELQLSEKHLKEQLNSLELCENKLHEKIFDLEKKLENLEDCLKTAQAHEFRLRELVNKYKLDEEIWLSESDNMESSLQRLEITENALREKMHQLHKRNISQSEELQNLKEKLKQTEAEKSSTNESLSNQEAVSRDLQNHIAELEHQKADSQRQIFEMQRVVNDLENSLAEVQAGNHELSHQIADLDLECSICSTHIQEQQTLQDTTGISDIYRKDLCDHHAEIKALKQKLVQAHVALKDNEHIPNRNIHLGHSNTSDNALTLEEKQWKTIESFSPDPILKPDFHWIKIAGATSLPSEFAQYGREDELTIGVNLSSEVDSISQPDTDSTVESNKNMPQTQMAPQDCAQDDIDSQPPSLPKSHPPILAMSKKGSNFVDFSQSSNVVSNVCQEELPVEVKEGVSRREGTQCLLHSSTGSFPDSGRDTSSVPSTSKHQTIEQDRTDLVKLQLKVNDLERDMESKNQYILLLEICVDEIEKALLKQGSSEEKTDAIKLSIKSLQSRKTDSNYTLLLNVESANLHAELYKKEHELVSKRNEVEKLMEELRQWQKECQTIEEMRTHALDSLHSLEMEYHELHNAEKEMKCLKDEYNEVRKRNEELEERCNVLRFVALERDEVQQELDGLRSAMALMKKTEVENISLEERLNATTTLLEERTKELNELGEEIMCSKEKIEMLERDNLELQKEKQDYNNMKLQDVLLKELSTEVKKLKTVSSPLTLLEELGQLEDDLAEEESNKQISLSNGLQVSELSKPLSDNLSRRNLKNEQRNGQKSEFSVTSVQQNFNDMDLSKGKMIPKITRCMEPPSQLRVEKTIGENTIMLAWIPPKLDDYNMNNGLQVTGYKIFQNSKQRHEVNSPHSRKAIITNVNLMNNQKFGVQTVSVGGETSAVVEVLFRGLNSSQNLPSFDKDIYDVAERRTFMGLYDYSPLKHSPQGYSKYTLGFTAGDVIAVYGSQRTDGFYYGEINGRRGLIPGPFVEEMP